MKKETKRIFISDLPQNILEKDIEKKFTNYGQVTSIEIKQRKDIGPKNNSLHFAFINVKIDDAALQQCFHDFNNNDWKGNHVQLQLAKESFLEKLKREREENATKTSSCEIWGTNAITTIANRAVNDVSSLPEQEENAYSLIPLIENNEIVTDKSDDVDKLNDLDDVTDLVIKNNRGKTIRKNSKLEIKSVCKEPITKVVTKPKSKDPKRMEADIKRVQSVLAMKRGYQQQKSLIKAALSNIDLKPRGKVIFDTEKLNETSETTNKSKKQRLFDDGYDDHDYNFEVKEQFQGEKGQKLLELQSRYKNDKRFALDARFLDNGEQENLPESNEKVDQISLEEKDKDLAILEEVLGKKIKPRTDFNNKRKVMLRFDPNHPEHTKYEVKEQEHIAEKKKRKRKASKDEEDENKTQEKPAVSKDTFYKVADTLKEALQEKESFSLLSTFGKSPEKDNKHLEPELNLKESTHKPILSQANPFRYDSSDDELEGEDEATVNRLPASQGESSKSTFQSQNVELGTSRLWTEPFFFRDDDFRLQEGIDFIRRLEVEEKSEFLKVRRNLKDITKAKVRNNQRKNKPFKKKLGGRKRSLKVKKAMKR